MAETSGTQTPKSRRSTSLRAEAVFRARLAELGVTLLGEEWRGVQAYYKAICPMGHPCAYCPANFSRGRGGCRTCGVKQTVAKRMDKAEAAFRARLAELGATLLEPEYLGADGLHLIRCRNGHEVRRRLAEINVGSNACRVCSGRDSEAAEQKFRDRLAELGATLLEPQWLGTSRPHRVLCAEGHECQPTPNNASKWGVCLRCRGWNSNAFYVITNEGDDVLKLGITTGDGQRRLNRHAAEGFTAVHRFLTDLPEGVAAVMERHVLALLKASGERPVRGREYFPARVKPVVLAAVDSYPASSSDTQKVSA